LLSNKLESAKAVDVHNLPLDDRHSSHHTVHTLADPPLSCVDWAQLQPMSWSLEAGLPRQLRNITQIITANITYVKLIPVLAFI
jgi:hypothetical protein